MRSIGDIDDKDVGCPAKRVNIRSVVYAGGRVHFFSINYRYLLASFMLSGASLSRYFSIKLSTHSGFVLL